MAEQTPVYRDQNRRVIKEGMTLEHSPRLDRQPNDIHVKTGYDALNDMHDLTDQKDDSLSVYRLKDWVIKQ